jgi:hypothetical protein
LLNDINLEDHHDNEDNLLVYKLFHEKLKELIRIDPIRPFNQITMGPSHPIVTQNCRCAVCVPTDEEVDSDDSTESILI